MNAPLFLFALLLAVPALAGGAAAHDCIGDDCGTCLSGTHEHLHENRTLYCESAPMGNQTPGPTLLALLAALTLGAAVLVRQH